MKHARIAAAGGALLALPFALAFQDPGTRIAFDVREGTELRKLFTNHLELGLDGMRVLRDGVEPDNIPELEMDVVTDLEIVVLDRYASLRESAPTELRRTYETISMGTDMSVEMDMQGQTHSQENPMRAESALEGESVVFTWNADEARYDVAFAEEEGDRALLDGLFEDMDLRAFLPGRDVAPGESWEVAPRALASVLAPGGDLKFTPQGAGYEFSSVGGQMGDLSDWFDEQLEGRVVCRFVETREFAGTRVAVIEIVLELENEVDLTEMAQEQMSQVELPTEAGEVEVETMTIDLSIEGDGILLWDLEAGHFRAMDVSGALEMQMEMSVIVELPGFGEVATEQFFDMSGSMTFGAEIE